MVDLTNSGYGRVDRAANINDTYYQKGFCLFGDGSLQADPNTGYVKVQNTGASGLFIRTAAGAGNIIVNGANAKGWDSQCFAATGQTQLISGATWYEVYLTNNCSVIKGWMSNGSTSAYLLFYAGSNNTSNYTINTQVNPSGTASISGGGVYSNGSNCTLNTSAIAYGKYFQSYTDETDAVVSYFNPYSFAVTQNKTITSNIGTCVYTLNPTSNNSVSSAGGSFSFTASSQQGCSLLANSNAPWLTVLGYPVAGNTVSVPYTVAQNTSTNSRTGTITIGIITFTVTQAGATPVPCTYNLSSYSMNIGSNGGNNSFIVGVTGGCNYQAISNNSNISIVSGASGSNGGQVQYSVAPNSTSIAQTFTINVNGQVHTINQSAAAINNYTITTTSLPNTGGTTSGSGTFVGGTLNTIIAYANIGFSFLEWRKNGLQVSNNSVYTFNVNANENYEAIFSAITPCSYTLSSFTYNIGSNGGNNSFIVGVTGGYNYQATSNNSNISIVSGASGSNGGQVQYSVAPNSTNTAQVYSINVNGQLHTINQAANIINAKPNLLFQSTNLSSLTPNINELVSMNITVKNNGTTQANQSIASIFISPTNQFIAGQSIWLKDININTIPINAIINLTTQINIPSPTGVKYILIILDPLNTMSELNENDNLNATQIQVSNLISNSYIDTYPYRTNSNAVCVAGNCTGDPWAMCKHWCTSYAAWKVNEYYGITQLNLQASAYKLHNFMYGTALALTCNSGSNNKLSNACYWDDIFKYHGLIVDNIPKVGAIAHWNSNENGALVLGHVAFVEEVTSNSFTVSEYYGANVCKYGKRTFNNNSSNKPGRFIHVENNALRIPDNSNSIEIFPNPNNGYFNISFLSNFNEQATINILDNMANVIKTENINVSTGNNSFYFQNQNLVSGIYRVYIRLSTGSIIKTFIVN